MKRVPDPFTPLYGGYAHRVDIGVAEAVTGVRGRSISRHAVEPAVQAGVKPSDAIALLHWGIVFGVGAAAVTLLRRR